MLPVTANGTAFRHDPCTMPYRVRASRIQTARYHNDLANLSTCGTPIAHGAAMLPIDSGGETYLEHVANAVQPLMNLVHAPSLFTAAESREIVEGARLRLARALEILYLAKGDT